MKFLDPTNDVAFKKLFGNDQKKEVLISLLNSLLKLKEGKKIVEVEIQNPYQVPKIAELKNTVLDVKCKDQRNISYLVEMQVAKANGFEKRVLYYTSKAYVNQIEIGEDYPHLNQVVFLGILDFNIFESQEYLSTHLILNQNTQEHALKDLYFNFVELPKFNKNEHQLQTIEDKWIYFLKNAKNLEVVPESMNEKELKSAFETLQKYGWNKEELEVYDNIAIYRQDERGRIEQAKMDGLKEGEEIGIEKGKIEGKIEEKKEVAQNLLKLGWTNAQIVSTDLNLPEFAD
ncbi:MAG: hypothetical protein A2Y41_04495 [Spirochaetes bacterium GWB1_36_13]|nr:MAG: hypothetical protein A2Y41_04495 [Spirochaetes bacterium GWB1_36_13]